MYLSLNGYSLLDKDEAAVRRKWLSPSPLPSATASAGVLFNLQTSN
jgi:hypothetical protein